MSLGQTPKLIGIISCVVVVAILSSCLYFKKEIEHFSDGTACFEPGLALKSVDIYLINLDRNKDRLDFFIEQYMKSDLRSKQFKRISAIDGKKLAIQEFVTPKAYTEITQVEKTGFRTKHYQLTRGAIGCYLSHLMAYDIIANGDAEYGLIFEDDVSINPDFWLKLNKILPSIPNDWDVLLMSCYCILCQKLDVYYNTERFWWMHCYIIKKDVAKRLADTLKSKLIEQQIDSELSDMVTEGHLKIFCLKETLSKQTGHFATDIQTPVSGVNPYATL